MSKIATEKTARNIEKSNFLVLATANNSQPWVAPLFYAYDNYLNFYVISGRETLHARHIEQNPHCALTIFNSTEHPDNLDWIKMSGDIKEVPPKLVPAVLDLYYQRRFPDMQERLEHRHVPEDFMGEAPHRFYQIRLTSISTMDLMATEDSTNRRVDVDMEAVRAMLFV